MILKFLFLQILLIPMDRTQSEHLKAYGIVYFALTKGIEVEWLLNYRGGSFLMKHNPIVEREANLRGVSCEVISKGEVSSIYSTIEAENMERVLLTVAPKVAVYVPWYLSPWDDAVRLALEYAEIPYDRVWDEEVLLDKIEEYDWIHLHHEDFTGQYGKFYSSFGNTSWFKNQVKVNKEMAKKFGFQKVWQLKHNVAIKIKEFVKKGGFLFAMCSATETIDIALAAYGLDIVPLLDGDSYSKGVEKKLNFDNTFAFTGFEIELNPLVYSHSNIDVTEESRRRGINSHFRLNHFSAKYDPIPTLLVQNHTKIVKEFLGQTTGFRRELLKEEVVILAEVVGTEEVKYIYGEVGEGFFSFYGGHDPEDYAHMVGEKPTYLKLYPNSPGYRLILNNVLFPAAKIKKLKT